MTKVLVRAADAPVNVLATLRVADRCDRCNAQAFVKATLSAGRLLFCGHHFRKHETALRASGARIVDERYRINSKP